MDGHGSPGRGGARAALQAVFLGRFPWGKGSRPLLEFGLSLPHHPAPAIIASGGRDAQHPSPRAPRPQPLTKPHLNFFAPRKHHEVSSWKVRVGSDKLGHFPSVPVAKIFVTELNTTYPKEKDIALVKLQDPLAFSGETWALRAQPRREGRALPLPLFQTSRRRGGPLAAITAEGCGTLPRPCLALSLGPWRTPERRAL